VEYVTQTSKVKPFSGRDLFGGDWAGHLCQSIYVPTIPNFFASTPTPTRPPESYITDAQNLETQGKLNMAITAYKQAIEVDPKNPANYVELCKLEIYTGDYADAVIQAENALLLNSKNDQAMALRGWALSFTGDYLTGEGAFKGCHCT